MSYEDRLKLSAIVACDPMGNIGLNGALPWSVPLKGDLKRFKELTMDYPVIMGRKTVETLPVELKGRTVIQCSTTLTEPLPKAQVTVPDLQQALAAGWHQLATSHPEWVHDETKPLRVWIAGGGKLYRTAWRYLDEIHLTVAHGYFAGDVRMPVLCHLVAGDLPDWVQASSERFEDHTYYVFKRP